VDLGALAAAAVGFSGADLGALCREAAMRALAGAAAAAGLLPAAGERQQGAADAGAADAGAPEGAARCRPAVCRRRA
jgi:hypothetical protein